MIPALVIFLHGVGARGADLASLADIWEPHLAGTRFASPDGPMPFDQGGKGRQWFSVKEVTPQNRPARIVAARDRFDDVLQGIVDAHGLADRLQEIALVGFSQGSIMALDAVVSGRWPVGKLVAFSGRLATAQPFLPPGPTKILLASGTADPIMPFAEIEDAERQLSRAGYRVQLYSQPGVGHSISSIGAVAAGAFLAGPA